MENYLDEIKKLISEKTGVEIGDITENAYFEEDLNVSEMELIEILTDLEDEHDIELIEHKDDILTVQDLMDLLIEKLE